MAVVTGSTSGIGRACAELFAAEGAAVVINGFPPEQGEQVVATRAALGEDAFAAAWAAGRAMDWEQAMDVALRNATE